MRRYRLHTLRAAHRPAPLPPLQQPPGGSHRASACDGREAINPFEIVASISYYRHDAASRHPQYRAEVYRSRCRTMTDIAAEDVAFSTNISGLRL